MSSIFFKKQVKNLCKKLLLFFVCLFVCLKSSVLFKNECVSLQRMFIKLFFQEITKKDYENLLNRY